MAEPRRGAPRLVEPETIAPLDRDPLRAALLPTDPPPPATEARTEAQQPPEVQIDAADVDSLPSLPDAPEARPPQTLSEMYKLVDDAWRQFFAAAGAFPSERMDERLNDGWTRKQMLAHIAAWHDLTHDRLGKLIMTGKPAYLNEEVDAINARVARQAIGRTGGEVVKEMEMTFNRLRRQLARLTDEQLSADDGWAAQVIAGNTYGHYEEHWVDVYMPPPADGRSGRR